MVIQTKFLRFFLLFFLASAVLSSCHPGLNYGRITDPRILNQLPEKYEDAVIDADDINQIPLPKKIKNINQVSEFIKVAQFVVLNESEKIGTACNHYLQRVLFLSGFKKGDFLANEFDIYAKNNFKSYKIENFKIDASRNDKAELKKYIWSYPARTPFILQWKRPGAYGHVAILERLEDSLVIYQASYNAHNPERTLTTIDALLSLKYRKNISLFSEFK